MPSDEELAFLERIRTQPGDDGPRLIFADWLDARGDTRGQLIRLQCCLEQLPDTDPRRDDLQLQVATLSGALQQAVSADLGRLAEDWSWHRGLIDAVAVNAASFIEHGGKLLAYGPIRRIRFLEASQCLAKLIASPYLRGLREIDLCGNYLGNSVIAQLARAPHLDELRTLQLGFNDLTDAGLRALAEIPHLANLCELHLEDNKRLATPGLRALADSPYFPNLRLLNLSGNALTDSAVRVLINAEGLTHLNAVALADNNLGDSGVTSLARSELLTRMLAHNPVLDLRRNNIGPVGARALAESPRVGTLRTLNLAGNVIGDAGLAALAQSPHLGQLEELIVSGNRISDTGAMALAGSELLATLRSIDLTGNIVNHSSIHDLHDAAMSHDWRRQLAITHGITSTEERQHSVSFTR